MGRAANLHERPELQPPHLKQQGMYEVCSKTTRNVSKKGKSGHIWKIVILAYIFMLKF